MSTFNEYNDYCDHIEKIMKGRNEDGSFKYKSRVLREMELRTKEILKRGLGDKKVAHDLVMDEFSEKYVIDGYNEFLAQEKEKRIARRLPVASALIMLASVVIYLAIGFVTGVWHPTWLIIEGCATAVLINAMFFGVTWFDRRKRFYILMRLIVMGIVMVLSQFMFLVLRIPMHIQKAYLVFLASLAMMFIGDLILATVTKQKLLIFNYLVTIPVVTVFAYVILGILHIIPWSWGAEIILLAVVVDLVVLWAFIRHNRKYIYKPEVNEEW